MLYSLYITFFAFLIPTVIFIISMVLSSNMFPSREKMSPFECGFDPKTSARIPFSLRFFLLAVIFLIFDLEIALLLPLPMSINLTPDTMFLSVLIFLIILILGLIHEWHEGSLNWK